MSLINKIINFELEEKSFKTLIIIRLITIISIILLVFLQLGCIRNYKIPKDIRTEDVEIVETDEIIYKINRVIAGTKFIEIEGWAYKKDQNIGYSDNRYVIRNEETKEYKVLNTQMTIVEELYSVDGKYDCRRAGMYTKALALDLKEGLYRIYIEYKNDEENMLIDTGIFFNYVF